MLFISWSDDTLFVMLPKICVEGNGDQIWKVNENHEYKIKESERIIFAITWIIMVDFEHLQKSFIFSYLLNALLIIFSDIGKID